jgi:hypothetical protein
MNAIAAFQPSVIIQQADSDADRIPPAATAWRRAARLLK